MTGSKRIVIISCGKQKLTCPALARELYTGLYFKATLGYALTIAPVENIFVLSAKYGLVRLDDRLKPYDLKMGEAGSVTCQKVLRQAERMGIAGRSVVALGGSRYVRIIRSLWSSVETPLDGKGGLFRQIAWLRKQTKETDR
ncbi:MAG: YaaA family protein [Acidobacteria bacterium]|nr:YaaA family protein [Acidobacteriota bacterium]